MQVGSLSGAFLLPQASFQRRCHTSGSIVSFLMPCSETLVPRGVEGSSSGPLPPRILQQKGVFSPQTVLHPMSLKSRPCSELQPVHSELILFPASFQACASWSRGQAMGSCLVASLDLDTYRMYMQLCRYCSFMCKDRTLYVVSSYENALSFQIWWSVMML